MTLAGTGLCFKYRLGRSRGLKAIRTSLWSQAGGEGNCWVWTKQGWRFGERKVRRVCSSHSTFFPGLPQTWVATPGICETKPAIPFLWGNIRQNPLAKHPSPSWFQERLAMKAQRWSWLCASSNRERSVRWTQGLQPCGWLPESWWWTSWFSSICTLKSREIRIEHHGVRNVRPSRVKAKQALSVSA